MFFHKTHEAVFDLLKNLNYKIYIYDNNNYTEDNTMIWNFAANNIANKEDNVLEDINFI